MTEQVLIEVDIERDDGDYKKLTEVKQALLNNATEVSKLKQAYKDELVTQKEFASELVRLEANSKKLNATYSETQRKVTGLKAPFQDLKQAIKDQSSQISVAGFSLAQFANPVTATVAILGGLFSAYAKSTIGAKDLEFASNQLGAATTILTNEFASLFSSAKDGEGIFSQVTNFIVSGFNPALGAMTKLSALAKEEMEDLGRTLLGVQGDNNERLAENAELMTKVQDSQTDYRDKLDATNQIIANLRTNETELKKVKEEQLKNLEYQLGLNKEDEVLQTAIIEKRKEITRIESDANRKVNAILRLESNLTDEYNKQAKAKANARQVVPAGKAADFNPNDRARPEDLEGALNRLVDASYDAQQTIKEGMFESTVVQEEELKKQSDDLQAAKNKDAAFMLQVFQESSQIFATELQKSNNLAIGLMKGYIKTLLNTFKRYIQFKLFGETITSPQSIATLGIAGLIQFAALNGLIEAAFAGAESLVSGFAQGGKVTGGRPISRSNGDNVLITAKTGEVILNEQQQAALGGGDTFRRLGVPGFAMGGMVIPSMSPASFSQLHVNQIVNAMHQLKIVAPIEDFEILMAQRAQIKARATLITH